MASMVCDKIAENKIKVVFDVPESNTYGYAADTKMRLNIDKMRKLGWTPRVGLEEAYRRLIGTASILSVFIKQTSFGIFTMLCVSAVVFFGVYFGILTVMKEPLVIDIENQLLKKIKHSK